MLEAVATLHMELKYKFIYLSIIYILAYPRKFLESINI